MAVAGGLAKEVYSKVNSADVASLWHLTLEETGLKCNHHVVLTEALGGVKNLKVTDPTTSSLKVRWEPAEGNVRQYRIFYVPASGGAEDMVRDQTDFLSCHVSQRKTGH